MRFSLNHSLPRRQTVFYTKETITIHEGEQITGTLACAPNARNNRDLDIKISWEAPNGLAEIVDYKMCVFLSDKTAFDTNLSTVHSSLVS